MTDHDDEYTQRVNAGERHDPDDPLRPPGYFVPSGEHRALCAHCDENVFQHKEHVLVNGTERFLCPRAPSELRPRVAGAEVEP